MQIIVTPDYETMSRAAADVIATCVEEKPDCVLGLATGTTPLGLYACLVADVAAGRLSFANVTTFNLDEYRGLAPTHVQSYHYFMQKNLFDHVDIDAAHTHVPEGFCADAQRACESYEDAIEAAGGIDLQLLGLGHNGHIGFNEPCAEFPKYTHCVALAESTINANSRLFSCADEVPREAYTMGIGTIMAAREIVLVASGADKADIVQRAFFGSVTPEVPASILQFHPNVTVFVDEAAGAKLNDGFYG